MYGFETEQQVIWNYEARGGYGYIIPVKATVKAFTPKGRVKIEVETVRGEKRTKYVKPESLMARNKITPEERHTAEMTIPFANG